mgnify:CR=1 FL=1
MQTITKNVCKEWNFLKERKILKINGTMLNKEQLENHLQKIASSHNLTNKSQKCPNPVPHMLEKSKAKRS